MPKIESGDPIDLSDLFKPGPDHSQGGVFQKQAGHSINYPYRQKARGPFKTFLDVEAIRETDRAILCVFLDGATHWIPKSQISDDSEVWRAGDQGKLIITEWLASQKFAQKPEPKVEASPSPQPDVREAYKLYRTLIRKYHPDLNQAPWAEGVAKDLTTLWQAFLKGK